MAGSRNDAAYRGLPCQRLRAYQGDIEGKATRRCELAVEVTLGGGFRRIDLELGLLSLLFDVEHGQISG